MKRAGKALLRVAGLALAITLAVFLIRWGWGWFSGNMLQGKYERATEIIAHEIQRVGELTAVKYTDSSVMHSSTKALLIGDVQTVSVPYTYEIGFGVHLNGVAVAAGEDGLVFTVPDEQMLDEQAAECRKKYLEDPACLENAWQETCGRIRQLAEQWTGEELTVTFQKPIENKTTGG